MKKQILNLGKALNKAEQQKVNGGVWDNCGSDFSSYFVRNCGDCVNTILPGAPTFCHKNCCIMAY